MSNGVTVALLGLLIAASSNGQTTSPVRRGFNAFNGTPYNLCSWIEVSAPETAKQLMVEQARGTYSQPDPGRLGTVEGKVFIEVHTVGERQAGCSNRTMTEVIFVNKDTDRPAYRLPIQSREIAMSNGFGAKWQGNDGIAIGKFDEFQAALAKGRYQVVIVYEDGGTSKIGQGVGMTVWSGSETSNVR